MATRSAKVRALAELLRTAAPLAAEVNSGYFTPQQRAELRSLVGTTTFLRLTDDLGQLYMEPAEAPPRAVGEVIDLGKWRRENETHHYDL